MRKLIPVLCLLLISLTKLSAQTSGYIVFEDRSGIDTVNVGSFKMLNNHVELERGNKSFHIFNLYFSKHNFRCYGLDRKAFTEANDDFHRIENDVLITLTPLTDSLERKMTPIATDDVERQHLIKPEDLLQEAIKNLFGSFSRNDIARKGSLPEIIKTTRYKMLIKRGGKYFRINAPILTEYYLIDAANYLFPDQYHYGEINASTPGQTRYVTGEIVDSILHRNSSGTANSYFPVETIARKTYLSSYCAEDGCAIFTYWVYPSRLNGPLGIGRFQFIVGIGIVNGTYGTFFDRNFIMHLENNLVTTVDDYNGPLVMKIKSINGLSLKNVCEKRSKQ